MSVLDLQPVVNRVVGALNAGKMVWSGGPLGSGRSQLVSALMAAVPGAVRIELIDAREPDAFVGSLLPPVVDAARSEIVMQHLGTTAEQAARELVQAVNQAQRVGVVRLRPSWTQTDSSVEASDSASAAIRGRHARGVLRELCGLQHAVWVADAGVDRTAVGVRADEEVNLGAFAVPLADVPFQSPALRDAARRLGEATGAKAKANPLVWRLAVGVVLLRRPSAWVAGTCAAGVSVALQRLVLALRELASTDDALRQTVVRIAQVRRPVPSQVLLDSVNAEERFHPLLTECLGYGSPVRVHPVVRRHLSAEERRSDRRHVETTHQVLATHYRSLDGATGPAELRDPAQALAWVEKLHHLGNGGEQTAAEWRQQQPASLEQYWDCARSLSHKGSYRESATVYQQGLDRFARNHLAGTDIIAYGYHYSAYNLEEAGEAGEPVERDYARAVELEPTNPWWNARYVSFLIKNRDLVRAQSEWREALDRVDPDGLAVTQSPWLAAHFHYWVAEAWIRRRCWFEAALVLRLVPRSVQDSADNSFRRNFRSLHDQAVSQRDEERRQLERWFADIAAGRSSQWRRAAAFWRFLQEQFSRVPTPAALTTDEGLAQLAWSHFDYYIDLEIPAEGAIEWYARDRRTGHSESGQLEGDDLSGDLKGWFSRMAGDA